MMLCARISVLVISPSYHSKFSYWIPKELFNSESLRTLEVKSCRLPLLNPSATPSGLTVLRLWRLSFSEDGEKVLKNILMVCKDLQCIELRSCSGLGVMKLNSRSLRSICISSLWPVSISLEDSVGLREAKIVLEKHDLVLRGNSWEKEDIFRVLKLSSSIETWSLELSLDFLTHWDWWSSLQIPRFPKLSNIDISIHLNNKNGSELLQRLLICFPALEELTVRVKYSLRPNAGLSYWDTPGHKSSSLSSLTLVRAYVKVSDEIDVSFLRYILACSPLLKKLYVILTEDTISGDFEFPLMEKASVNAEIIIYSLNGPRVNEEK